MNAVGGYFGLELAEHGDYHPQAVKVNSGRNALEYILRVNNYTRLFVPSYTCPAVLEPLYKLKIQPAFYHIDKTFAPIDLPQLNSSDGVLYINYFGINQDIVTNLVETYDNLIVDNSQAYFSIPDAGTDVFYSPRKFFGVPDGGLVYTKRNIIDDLCQDISYTRSEHLMKRIDIGAEEGYIDFTENEARLALEPLRSMSNLTMRMLKSIQFDVVQFKRNQNFLYLHENLNEYNELTIEIDDLNAPMAYPFLSSAKNLRQYMADRQIYIPQYWKEVADMIDVTKWECYLSNHLLALPVDQRYGKTEMNFIIESLKLKL